jgi:GT2 family glycosyltransferase
MISDTIFVCDKIEIQSRLDEILLVVVIYRRNLASTDSVVSLSRALEKCGCTMELMVYDNSPSPQESALTIQGISRIIYHHNPSNPGVSKAYNEGARIAGEYRKKWLLLLDQDTLFQSNAFYHYLDALAANPFIHMFAPRLLSDGHYYSPCRYYYGFGYYLKNISAGLMSLKWRTVINSGMLVSLQSFNNIGGFDEKIPLDFADHDFCLRFSTRYKEAFILDMDCDHGFSNNDESISLESALVRFSFFCRGARFSVKSFSQLFTHSLVLILHCGALSLRYHTCKFLHLLIKYF